MSWTVRQIAELVEGEVFGDGGKVVSAARPLTESGPDDITLVDGEKNVGMWNTSKAGSAIVPRSFPSDARPVIQVDDPLAAFLKVVLQFRGTREIPVGIDPAARIHPTASLGPNASVGAYAVIGADTTIGANCHIYPGVVIGRFCRLGDNVTIYPNSVLYDDCVLGHRVTIHANAVIGADGFGYRLRQGQHEKIPQVGGIHIADDVEVGAGSTLDGGTFGPTRIGSGTKIDNLVMISHNCQIGSKNIIVAQVGIAGSSRTDDFVVMAGQVGVADHVHIGQGAVIGAQCGVISDVPAGAKYLGTPGMPSLDYFRCVANWSKVSELRKEVAAFRKHFKSEEPA